MSSQRTLLYVLLELHLPRRLSSLNCYLCSVHSAQLNSKLEVMMRLPGEFIS